MTEPLPIASFKLSFVGVRVRIVPALDATGCPFAGPGVDLVGEEASVAFAAAAPIIAWLATREPVQIRTLSFDVDRARLLVTVDAQPRPRVVRIDPRVDPGASAELRERAAPLVRHLGTIARAKLAARVL